MATSLRAGQQLPIKHLSFCTSCSDKAISESVWSTNLQKPDSFHVLFAWLPRLPAVPCCAVAQHPSRNMMLQHEVLPDTIFGAEMGHGMDCVSLHNAMEYAATSSRQVPMRRPTLVL